MNELILGLILVFLFVRTFSLSQRVKHLEGLVRNMEVQANTCEANINRLYHFRQVEDLSREHSLTDEDLSLLRQELEDTNAVLYGRNKYLLEEWQRKK